MRCEKCQIINEFSTIRGVLPKPLELEQLEKQNPALFETYHELMCNFYICLDVHHVHGNVKGLTNWADNLFPTLDDAPEEIHVLVAGEHISSLMSSRDTLMSSWKRMTGSMRKAMSSNVFIAEQVSSCPEKPYYLPSCQYGSKSVVPSLPHDGILLLVPFSIMQLVYG